MEQNFAFMRHAMYRGDEDIGEDVSLAIESVELCKENIDRLVEKVGKGQLLIFHTSPKKRAILTRDAVAEHVTNRCPVLVPPPLDWLDVELGFTIEDIERVVQRPDAFYLFVAHAPDIEAFLGNGAKVTHGEIINKEFSIN